MEALQTPCLLLLLPEASFEEAPVPFSVEERRLLDPTQRALYREVTPERYGIVASLGWQAPKPPLISQLEDLEQEKQSDPEAPAGNGLEGKTKERRICLLMEESDQCLVPEEDVENEDGTGEDQRNGERKEALPCLEGGTCEGPTCEQTHQKGKRKECPACGKRFACKMALDNHRKTHRGERKFRCRECGRTFNRPWRLSLHQRIHTGEEMLFKCLECGKSFQQRGSLTIHQRTHKAERPLKCLECGKIFQRRGSLTIHQRTHTAEQPLKCLECGKSFSARGDLASHHASHLGKELFLCLDCGETFSQSGDFTKHQRTHRSEKLFKCKTCGKSFRWRPALVFHHRFHAEEKVMFARNVQSAPSPEQTLVLIKESMQGSDLLYTWNVETLSVGTMP